MLEFSTNVIEFLYNFVQTSLAEYLKVTNSFIYAETTLKTYVKFKIS